MIAERPFIGTSVPTARRIATLTVTLVAAVAISAVVLHLLVGDTPGSGLQTIDVLAWATGALTYAVVGVVVAWRRSANAIGWLFLLIGVTGTTGCLGVTYAAFAASTGSPGAAIAAWYTSGEFVFGTGLILNVFVLLFPTGRVPSRRWVPVLAAGLLGMALSTVGFAFGPGQLIAFPLENPFGIADAAATFWLIGDIGIALQVVAACAAAASVGVRLMRADHIERQQLKWMGAAVSILLVGAILGGVGGVSGVGRSAFGTAAGSLALNCIPIAAGIAILRYRLYDIDVLVNRALVYGGTTAMVAAAFFGGIVLLQALLRPFTGGNELAVAGSTLVCFALFQPLRSRVQVAVDRRFYHSRYDAARTLDEFSERLRDEIDLEAVAAELVAAIHRTVQPAHAGVWLRERRP
jgi:hypothetical protein